MGHRYCSINSACDQNHQQKDHKVKCKACPKRLSPSLTCSGTDTSFRQTAQCPVCPRPPVPRDMKWGHGGQRIECASHGMARCACGSGGGESSCSTSPNTTPLGWACGAQERTQPARRPPSGAQTQLGNPPRVPDQLGSLPRCPQPGGHLTKATG